MLKDKDYFKLIYKNPGMNKLNFSSFYLILSTFIERNSDSLN